MRRAALVGAWLIVSINLALLGKGLGGFWEKTSHPADRSIRLLTLNVQFFLSAENRVRSNLDAIAEVLAAERPDIVGFQETEVSAAQGGNQNGVLWLAAKHGFHYYYGLPSSDYTPGVALLSRWPITAADHRVLPFSRSVPRGAARVLIATPEGELTVIVGHLQWAAPYLPGEPTAAYEADQTAQALALLAMAGRGRPTVVMGDFNAGPGYPGPAYPLFRERFIDAWVAAGNDALSAAGFTWPAARPTMRIDFIWLSKGDWDVAPGSARCIGSTALSDHRATMVTVSLRSRGTQSH